jgi:Flp pilus assembly secretin CpaC
MGRLPEGPLALTKEIAMPTKASSRTSRFLKPFAVSLLVPLFTLLSQAQHATAAAIDVDSSVTVKADQATLVALAGEPATVVIGNALYADVTLKKGMIVIHGRQFGTTNVIVLDKDNIELANFELHVVRGGSNNLTIYKAGSAFSHVCAPVCESALQVGDNAEHFGAVNSAMSTKLQLSTGAGGLTE